MDRSALTSFHRSLTRHRLYATLNIGGLAVGIAVFLVLGLYVRFETSFERWLPRHDRIYVVQTVWNLPGSPFNGAYPYTMGGLLDQLRQDFPGVVGTRFWGGEGAGSVLRGAVAATEDVAVVDPSFFQVFDLPMARGDGPRGLADPGGALISETAARRYFGSGDPVGQTLTVGLFTPTPHRIIGVFRDLPANSDFKVAVLLPMPRITDSENWYHWGSSTLPTCLRFDTPAAARRFAELLPAFIDRRGLRDMGPHASRRIGLALLPIARLHLEPEGSASASQKMTVATLGLVGVLTLLIAVVNYVNLATARAGLRAREVAMRKVLGADRTALMRQFLGEAVLTVAAASLGGLILAELGLPFVNAAGGLSLSVPYALVVPALGALTLVVGLLAGLYPAVLLSRYPAAAVLASARAPGGGRAGTRAREALVVVQFGLAIAFTVATAVLLAQTRHVRLTDLGFRRDGLLVVGSFQDSAVTPARRRALVAAIEALPGVRRVGLANGAAGGTNTTNSDNVELPGVPGDGPSLRWVDTGAGFFQAYGVRPVAGRLFDDAHGGDDSDHRATGAPINIVINRRAVGTLGFRSPEEAVGRTVGVGRPRQIIGVVPDLRFGSPREPVAATYYIYSPDTVAGPAASVRFAGDPRAMLAAVRGVWRRMAPDVPFAGDLADRRLAQFYRADDRATRLFAIGAGLAVLIGCVGLWGLASFNTARRVKEIGIRKTLGASSADVARLLVGQFLRPVLIANLIAWPLAFAAMRAWLAGFDDRVALSPLYFLGAGALAVLVAVVTVLGQSLRASRAAPAWALRHD